MSPDASPELLTIVAGTMLSLGFDEFTLEAVAENAGLPLEQIQQTFGSREAALSAAVNFMGDFYFQAMETVAERADSLAEVVSEACVEAWAHGQRLSQDLSDVARRTLQIQLLATVSDTFLERTIEFWAARVLAAQATGEVRADVVPREAAEWIVRITASFELMPPFGATRGDPDAFRELAKTFVVDGLGH